MYIYFSLHMNVQQSKWYNVKETMNCVVKFSTEDWRCAILYSANRTLNGIVENFLILLLDLQSFFFIICTTQC